MTDAPFAGLISAGAPGVGGGAGGVTVRVAVRLTPPKLAVIVTGVEAVTLDVVMANVAVVAPAATVTEGGTAAALPLLESMTAAPPAGAAALSVTVPVADAPPETLEGETARVDSVAVPGGGGAPGSTQSTGCSPFPSLHTVSITGVDTDTECVVTVNVALLAPAGTVTLAGTDATEGLLLVSV